MTKVRKTLNQKQPGNNRLKKTKNPALQSTPQVQLTLANAPIYQAKFLEGIRDELRKLNEFVLKQGA